MKSSVKSLLALLMSLVLLIGSVQLPAWAASSTPGVPKNLKVVSATCSSLKISWSAVSSVSGYEVYRYNTSKKIYDKISITSKVSFTNVLLTTGKSYTYKVRSYKSVNNKKTFSAYSAAVSCKPVLPAPVSPKAVSASYNSIKISWPVVSGASGYEVYRYNTGTKKFDKIKAVTLNTYTDTGLTAGRNYTYKVIAFRTIDKANVYSGFSAECKAAPIPTAPAPFTVAGKSSSSILVSWKAVAGASYYEVYRFFPATGQYARISTTTANTFTDTNLASGTYYYYKVRAAVAVAAGTLYGPFSVIASSRTTIVYEVALITDLGTVDDGSFNQSAWEGVQQYANQSKKACKYYKPAEPTTDGYMAAIDLAVKGGAKIVVCPGYLFEVPVYLAQTRYPAVKFILLDGEPHNEDYSIYKTESNVTSILFAEQQSGFLAGYAAVKDGMRSLGFMGGMAVPAVIRYGYGYIQGAEAAAKELKLAKKSVTLKYTYVGGFSPTPEIETEASGWYTAGTQAIFACGGALGNSVMAAAETANKKVIGVDSDQSKYSNSVITSAMKILKQPVCDAIASVYSGKFKGGATQTLGAAQNAVGLLMDTSRFTKFSKTDYQTVYDKVAAGKYTIFTDTQVGNDGDPTQSDWLKLRPALSTEYVDLIFVK